jgi:hypothetical protein
LINFLVTGGHDTTIRPYVDTWVPERSDRFSVLAYEDLAHLDVIPAGTTIFGDLERLSPAQMRLARCVRDCIADQASGAQILNDPDTALLRYELLAELHAQGTIPYRAYRLTETTTPERFPVFIRNADDHAGPRTGLLHDQDELDTAIVGLIVRRHPLQRLIIVEYHDTADDTGMYRKYGAFVVGDRIIARHLNFRQGWIVKKAHLETPEINAEEMAYVKSNPHQEELARICKMGGVQYGRIDYSIRDGQIVTWEINTNPVVVKVRGTQSETSMARQLVFVPALTEAFEAIDDRVHHGQSVSLAAIPAAVREGARRGPARAGGGARRLAGPGKPMMEAAMKGISTAARPFRKRIIATKLRQASR